MYIFELLSNDNFKYGNFRGYVREGEFSCWLITISGSDKRAWREVEVLKKKRTIEQAIKMACSMFNSPDEIKIENGKFGYCVKYDE